MTRIVVGNRDGALALSHARSIVAELAGEWPDINIIQRTVPAGADSGTEALFSELADGRLGIAIVSMERLPGRLPDGLKLMSVTRRVEARSTLLVKGGKTLASLPAGARVGVPSPRDALFLEAVAGDVESELLSGNLDESLRRFAEDALDAVLLPAATLLGLDRRNLIEELIDQELFPPASGQGSIGLVVREDDDMAGEIAYTLQHRPSYDRARAERAFVGALEEKAGDRLRNRDGQAAIGALAAVTPDGELTLFGSVIATSGNVLQAVTSGEAAEAVDLGRELADDFILQLENL